MARPKPRPPCFLVLLLSASGIHALMSFIVVRRTREIGIRVALGAPPTQIVLGIFTRAFLQVALGILAGSGQITSDKFDRYAAIGELALDGTMRPTNCSKLWRNTPCRRSLEITEAS